MTKLDAPITPRDFMTLDGTLYVDRAGAPWMVYAHEWIQKVDGTMEANARGKLYEMEDTGGWPACGAVSGGSERAAVARAARAGAAGVSRRG